MFQYIGSKSEDGAVPGSRPDHFCLVEKWRKIERPLGQGSKVLRVWQAWGEDKSEVRLVVKRSATSGAQQQPGTAASAFPDLPTPGAGGSEPSGSSSGLSPSFTEGAGRT